MEGFYEKTLFEIYRDGEFNRRYKVVYFSELSHHQRDEEFPKALMGDHYFDGFLTGFRKDEAKTKIDEILDRLNAGERLDPKEVATILKPYLEQPTASL